MFYSSILKNPLVTVVCSCFEHESFVEEALLSVIHQNYEPIQIIVIDDKSQDNSWKIIQNLARRYPQLEIVQNPTRLGITKSFNSHFPKVKGEYYIDLATDDVLLPNAISTLVNALNSDDQETAFVFGNAKIIDEQGKELNTYYTTKNKPYSGRIHFPLIYQEFSMNSGTAVYKTRVFQKLGGYDESLLFEDLEFWLRVTSQYKVKYIDAFILAKRRVMNSLGMNLSKKKGSLQKQMQQQEYKIYKTWIEKSKEIDQQKIGKLWKTQIHKNLKTHNVSNALRWFALAIKTYLKRR